MFSEVNEELRLEAYDKGFKRGSLSAYKSIAQILKEQGGEKTLLNLESWIKELENDSND